MTDSEEWRSVPGYEGLYEVSSRGRVRSLDHEVSTYNGGSYIMAGRLLKHSLTKQGYHVFKLYRSGVGRERNAHRLVAEAFIPNPEGYPLVRHWDDDPGNNAAENLLWGNNSDNQKDAVRNGKHNNGRQGITHCPKNHEYTEDNLYYRKGTKHRVCRKCAMSRSRAEYWKDREPAKPKEFCKRGHPLSGENLYTYPSGRRSCRECMREHARNWRKKKEVESSQVPS